MKFTLRKMENNAESAINIDKIEETKPKSKFKTVILLSSILIFLGVLWCCCLTSSTQDESSTQDGQDFVLPYPLPRWLPLSLDLKLTNQLILEFWDSIRPSIACSQKFLTSVGGGGWICGLRNSKRVNRKGCLVYTLGGETESFKFELDIVMNSYCNVVAFTTSDNLTINPIIQNSWNHRILFINAMNKNETVFDFKTILKDASIDILKVDVDISNIDLVEQSLVEISQTQQITLRFHWFEGIYFGVVGRVLNVINKLQNQGFRIFHAEASCKRVDDCVAGYSFINVKSFPPTEKLGRV